MYIHTILCFCDTYVLTDINELLLQVRMAAFQALGPFISTFADPLATGLSYNEETGELALNR